MSYPFTIRPGSRVKLRWFEPDHMAQAISDPDGVSVGAGVQGRFQSAEGVVEAVTAGGPGTDVLIHLEGVAAPYRASFVVEHRVGRPIMRPLLSSRSMSLKGVRPLSLWGSVNPPCDNGWHRHPVLSACPTCGEDGTVLSDEP